MPVTRASSRYTVLNAKAANGVGSNINVSDYQFVVLTLTTAAASTLTLKVQGAVENPVPVAVGVPNVPDFSVAASPTNAWTYMYSYDLDPNTGVAGSTGYPVSAASIVKTVKVNTADIDWLNVQVSGLSAGSATVWAVGYTNA